MREIVLPIATLPVKLTSSTRSSAMRGVTTAAKPDKELTLREKVIGTYEHKEDGERGESAVVGLHKLVFLENGVCEWYLNGKKGEEAKWSISKEGELHVTDGSSSLDVVRINKDGSITFIADIRNGERDDYAIEDQGTLKKIK